MRIVDRVFLMLMLMAACLWPGSLVAAKMFPPDNPQHKIQSFISRLELAAPRSQGSLTIVPLCGPATLGTPIHTLSEGMRDGLIVSEIGDGRVNQLYVENNSSDSVFIMAGQILVGAKQNRVLQHDMLLPPKSGRISVDAYCVQHGRWTSGNDQKFIKSDNVSNPQVRQAARVEKQQSQVWGAVSKTQKDLGKENSTADLNQVYAESDIQEKIKDYRSHLLDLPDHIPQMQGAVAILNGRILAVDAFDSRHVFRRLWEPLLNSYLLEALNQGSGASPDARGQAREFLREAAHCQASRLATPGSGVLVELTGGGISGESLLCADGVLHLELFAHGRSDSAAPYERSNEPPIRRHY